MATFRNGPMFLKAVNCFGEVKDKFFIANLMKEVIDEAGHQNVVQIITNNASNCKGAGEIIESMYPHIYWTPCVVHTLNLALKNICSAKNIEGNEETYDLCNWITEIHGDAVQIKNFIMNRSMRFKLIKRRLQAMVISDEWASYREDDTGKANFVKEKLVSDDWWDKIIIARWTKSYTPLHCLAHSLNPRFYSDGWLTEDLSRVAPHRDGDVGYLEFAELSLGEPDLESELILEDVNND
ncbi:hypothetical protein HRI_003310800 [Hibiscus trionum]|uniref:DUF659 domain-containing protein n=1 Tax=Hibiscus trionum TaxID=183268 RepID=A0A9W7IK77_HIBTR|nr:hypothetical protein HRI_003310800 [Hibiscus trionum]